MNHNQHNQRVAFVQSLLVLNNLQAKSIKPVEYDINGPPFPYNNFIFLVTLSSPKDQAIQIRPFHSDQPQPGTVQFPANATSLIVRLANADPRTGVNNTNRIESEVAFITLARQALAKSKYSHILPDVYAWASMSTGQGFSVQQYMAGTMPDRAWKDLTLRAKSAVLGQMAEILIALQNFEIPATVEKFGGLTFSQNGSIISAQMSLFTGEPSTTYKEFIQNILRVKLQEADNNPVIQGWREHGVRDRLEKFKFHLEVIFGDHKAVRKTLIHSDLTTNNLLFDASTFQLTALLDFDFSYVGTIAEEFMGYSFQNLSGGKLPGPFEGAVELELRNAMLTGFPNTTQVTDGSEIEWDVAKAWDDELVRAGAERPSTIPHFEEIADVYWLLDQISPFELDNPMMRKGKTAEQLLETREKFESLIVRYLERYKC